LRKQSKVRKQRTGYEETHQTVDQLAGGSRTTLEGHQNHGYPAVVHGQAQATDKEDDRMTSRGVEADRADANALDRSLAVELFKALPVLVPPGMTIDECAAILADAVEEPR